jgi:spore coat protein U-like protein
MQVSGHYINYGLYLDTNHTQPWSTTTSATSCTGGSNTCYLGTGSGANQNVTVYGQVPSQTIPFVGTYLDTVVVTATY